MKSDNDLSLLGSNLQQPLNLPLIVLFESDNVLGWGMPKYFPLGSFKTYSYPLEMWQSSSNLNSVIQNSNYAFPLTIYKRKLIRDGPRFMSKNSVLSLTTGIQVTNTFKWWLSKFSHMKLNFMRLFYLWHS